MSTYPPPAPPAESNFYRDLQNGRLRWLVVLISLMTLAAIGCALWAVTA